MEYNEINIIDIVPSNKSDYLHRLSVAITHYIFRNGPVQHIHKGGKLTDVEMKELNIFMTNRIAYICLLLMDEEKVFDIKKYCDIDFIEEIICSIIRFCFLDGPIKNKYSRGVINYEDMKIILNYMWNNLKYVINLILRDNDEEIKDFLLISYVFGLNWKYTVPDKMEFQRFLEYLKKNKNYNIIEHMI